MSDLYKLQDPTKQYPQPKFEHQQQSVPGIDGKMTPKPDHGETSYKGNGRLPDRKALVTGGDSGIGRATAIAFAREGADVAINYLPEEEEDAKETIALIEKAGRKAIAIPGDLSDEAFCVEMVKQAHKQLGGLDYAPTKAAILAFTRALARQVAEDGIRVNCVAPGPVWTPLQTSGGQPDKKIPDFGSETPMKRPGQPVEMAPLYVLLASQESSYVTGEVYGATGGLEIS
jgi:NAD(P)-dependent dehydrogenase (short-subunit alcohol dehydrogenase family)